MTITTAHDSWYERNEEDGYQYAQVAFFVVAYLNGNEYVHEHRFGTQEEADVLKGKVEAANLTEWHFQHSAHWAKTPQRPSLEEVLNQEAFREHRRR